MKTSLLVLCLILGYWVYQTSSTVRDPEVNLEPSPSLTEIKNEVIPANTSERRVAMQVNGERVSAAIEHLENDPLVYGGVRYKSKEDFYFHGPESRQAKNPFYRKLYEDVGLTAEEATKMGSIEVRASEEIYKLAVQIDRPTKSRAEARALLKWFSEEKHKIEIRAVDDKKKVVGASRYEILIEGKERFAQEYEAQNGAPVNTEGW